MRHHTSQPSFNEIPLPKTPVKPHKNTAVCNLIKAPFIASKKRRMGERRIGGGKKERMEEWKIRDRSQEERRIREQENGR